MNEDTVDEKYWILGFLGFMGGPAFPYHDP